VYIQRCAIPSAYGFRPIESAVSFDGSSCRSFGAREAGLFLSECEMKSSSPFIPTTARTSKALLWTPLLGVGELVVPRRVRILLMKLPEFLQTAYRKVVEWFFRPVFSFRIIEPLDKVEDSFVISPAAFRRGHYFVDIVSLRLLNVVSFSQHLRWVRRCSVFAGSVWFEERDMEDVVDLPFLRKG